MSRPAVRRWARGSTASALVAVAVFGVAIIAGPSAAGPSAGGPAATQLDATHASAVAPVGTVPAQQPATPAPAGFAQQLEGLGATTSTLDQEVGAGSTAGVPAEPTGAQYEQIVSTLSPTDLSSVYDAFESVGGVGKPASELQSVESSVGTTPSSSASSTTPATSSGTSPIAPTGPGAVSIVAPVEALSNGPIAPAPPPSSTVQPASTSNCPLAGFAENAADPTIFALDEVIDILGAVAGALPRNMPVAFGVDFAEDPAYGILELIKNGVIIIRDTMAYLQTSGNLCIGDNQTTYLTNIANTAQQSYVLLHQYVSPGLSTISQQLQTLQTLSHSNDDQQVRIEIEQALAAPGATPIASDELPTCDGGDLGPCPGSGAPPAVCPPSGGVPDPVTVEAVVTCDLHALQGAGQAIDPSALSDLSQAATAMNTGSYKTAYADYEAAYQAMAG